MQELLIISTNTLFVEALEAYFRHTHYHTQHLVTLDAQQEAMETISPHPYIIFDDFSERTEEEETPEHTYYTTTFAHYANLYPTIVITGTKTSIQHPCCTMLQAPFYAHTLYHLLETIQQIDTTL